MKKRQAVVYKFRKGIESKHGLIKHTIMYECWNSIDTACGYSLVKNISSSMGERIIPLTTMFSFNPTRIGSGPNVIKKDIAEIKE